jgi:hypothetical protein
LSVIGTSKPASQPRISRSPIRHDRIRRIDTDGGFAFLPNRFLHAGFFASVDHVERSLYLFLVLGGDRNGVSFYSADRICATLEITLDDYLAARNALIEKDLLAFDGTRFQILSLPPAPISVPRSPLVSPQDFERDDPATIRQIIRTDLGTSRRRHEP